MTNKEFMCWVNGFLTLSDDHFVDAGQVAVMRNHANLVAAIDGRLAEPVSQFVIALEKLISSSEQIAFQEVKILGDFN